MNGPTRGQSQRSRWRRTSHGFYVPTETDSSLPEQRIMEQSVRLPNGSAVTGWGACRLLRANFFDGLRADRRTLIPIPLALGSKNQIREDELVSLSRDPLDPAEVITRYGIPCTRGLRALFDEARHAGDVREAVVAIDMMAAAEQGSINQLRRYVATRAGWHGSPQVRRALDLASEDSRSPNETRMRLIWQLDAGLPRPLVNRPVFDLRGRLLGIADLLDVEAGVVGEFDGADHRGAERHTKDVAREERFRGVGLEYFTVTGLDLPVRAKVVGRMRSTRDRAKWLAASDRQWTIESPHGWQDEPSLDMILVQREMIQEMHRQFERDGGPGPAQIRM